MSNFSCNQAPVESARSPASHARTSSLPGGPTMPPHESPTAAPCQSARGTQVMPQWHPRQERGNHIRVRRLSSDSGAPVRMMSSDAAVLSEIRGFVAQGERASIHGSPSWGFPNSRDPQVQPGNPGVRPMVANMGLPGCTSPTLQSRPQGYPLENVPDFGALSRIEQPVNKSKPMGTCSSSRRTLSMSPSPGPRGELPGVLPSPRLSAGVHIDCSGWPQLHQLRQQQQQRQPVPLQQQQQSLEQQRQKSPAKKPQPQSKQLQVQQQPHQKVQLQEAARSVEASGPKGSVELPSAKGSTETLLPKGSVEVPAAKDCLELLKAKVSANGLTTKGSAEVTAVEGFEVVTGSVEVPVEVSAQVPAEVPTARESAELFKHRTALEVPVPVSPVEEPSLLGLEAKQPEAGPIARSASPSKQRSCDMIPASALGSERSQRTNSVEPPPRWAAPHGSRLTPNSTPQAERGCPRNTGVQKPHMSPRPPAFSYSPRGQATAPSGFLSTGVPRLRMPNQSATSNLVATASPGRDPQPQRMQTNGASQERNLSSTIATLFQGSPLASARRMGPEGSKSPQRIQRTHSVGASRRSASSHYEHRRSVSTTKSLKSYSPGCASPRAAEGDNLLGSHCPALNSSPRRTHTHVRVASAAATRPRSIPRNPVLDNWSLGAHSLTGRKEGIDPWPNQDAHVALRLGGGRTLLLAVFDGHGPLGHFFSECARALIVENAANILRCPPAQALPNMFAFIEARLKTDFPCNVSGTTATVAVVDFHTRLVTTAHVGDSRMVIFNRNHQPIFATKDHTIDPTDPFIRAAGGEVRKETACGVTAYRIFVPGTATPGLAMGRSLGDQIAHSLGCRSAPDVSEIPLEEGQTLVLASDGLWDKLHAGTVSVLVHASEDANAAARHTVTTARAQWDDEPNIDDVTAVILRY